MNRDGFHEFFYDASLDENPDPALQVYPPPVTDHEAHAAYDLRRGRVTPCLCATCRARSAAEREAPTARDRDMIRIFDRVAAFVLCVMAAAFVIVCAYAVATGAVERLVAR